MWDRRRRPSAFGSLSERISKAIHEGRNIRRGLSTVRSLQSCFFGGFCCQHEHKVRGAYACTETRKGLPSRPLGVRFVDGGWWNEVKRRLLVVVVVSWYGVKRREDGAER